MYVLFDSSNFQIVAEADAGIRVEGANANVSLREPSSAGSLVTAVLD